METHASETITGELPVTPAPHGGVIITLGSIDVLCEDTEDADRGIRAFAEAKRLLAGEPCPAWIVVTDDGTAVYCEAMSGHAGDHFAPGVKQGDPDISWPQNIRRGIHPYPDMRIIQGERPYPPLPPACEAPSPKGGYLCTLTAGHEGQHEAHYWEDGRLLEAWPREDEPHAHQPVSYVAFDTPTLAGDPGGAA